MKKNFVIVLLILIPTSYFAQINEEIAYRYIAEIQDTALSYRDVVITNADNRPYPAVGNYHLEMSYYYDYSHYHGTSLQLIVDHSYISAVQFTKYFVYDDFQNLVYYIYQCDECGSLVMKFDGKKSEIVESSERVVLSDNYFLDIESEFNPENILEESKVNLYKASAILGVPVYEDQTLAIREEYNRINGLNNLVEEKNNDITVFYEGDDLVKIIDNTINTKEYYLKNDRLFFAYYPAFNEDPDIRIYFADGGKAYKVIYGKDLLPKTGDEFHAIREQIEIEFEELLFNLQLE